MTDIEMQIIALKKEIRDKEPSPRRRRDLEKALRRKKQELARRLASVRKGGCS